MEQGDMSTSRLVYFGLGGALALAFIAATPAAAHVTVQPGEAPKGGYAKLAFRVPNESETAGTVKLEVTFPLDSPVASLRTKPMAGWTAEVRKEKLPKPVKSGDAEITEGVRSVVWTAQPGVRIGPGEFDEFEVSGGPLPDNTDQLQLPATQTYDDGTVVSWNAPPPAPGAEEAEHPAPLLKLVAATGEEDGDVHGGGTTNTPASQPAGSAMAPTAGRDDTARWLGGAGLVVGALGVGLAAGAMLASRRRGGTTAGPGDAGSDS
jgi:uncharacterized protein YcnI